MRYEVIIYDWKTFHSRYESFTGFTLRKLLARIKREGWKHPVFSVLLLDGDSGKPLAYKPWRKTRFNFKRYKEKNI